MPSMKIVLSIIAAAVLLSSAVMFYLVKQGAALRPAGVIKPAEIGNNPDLIGQSIALRLFPDFQTATNVVWYMDLDEEPYASVAATTLANYQTQFKPSFYDLRKGPIGECRDRCWYVQSTYSGLPESLLAKIENEPTVEIYVQYFSRGENVPEECDNAKTLMINCVRPVSVREVRKKIKTPAPHFFMRRYLDSKFYLFIEIAEQ